MYLSRSVIPVAAVLLSLPLVASCGTDQYQERLLKSNDEFRKGEVFHKFLQVTPYNDPAIGLSLRLPTQFTEPMRTTEDEKKLEFGYRVQPPDAKLPGFRYSGEAILLVDAVKMPSYVYFYVLDAKAMKAEQIQTLIRMGAKVFKDAPDAWTDAPVRAPDDTTKSYKLYSLVAPQKFDPGDSGAYKDYPGRFDIYMTSTDTHHLLVGWRAPDVVSSKNQYFEAAKAAMGTLTFTGPPAEGATPMPMSPMNPTDGAPMPMPMQPMSGAPMPMPTPMNPMAPVGPMPMPMPMPMVLPPSP